MKKFKISLSFFILVVICICLKNFLVLLNYFIALTIHEFSHLIVSNIKGYKLKKIKLDMFGMSIDLDSPIDERDNFWINIAGPLSNLFVCLICLALYWLFPLSYFYLNTFCIANLTLAIFNLLPIYPLDGGKIFYNLFSNKKHHKFISLSIRIILTFVSLCFAIINPFNNRLLFLLIAFFFATSNKKPIPSFVFLKQTKNLPFQKIELIKIDDNMNLYSLIKLLKSKKYTIFYCESLNQKYFNQDDLLNISLKHPLSTKIKNCQI
ncbi:MAG: site-2 protease family protein [Clostridia bacterium]|nr:site-2 protease family protein [Clostridia bacterium]